MDKGIGFNRNILLRWLNVAAELAAEGLPADQVRPRLDAVVSRDIASEENRRKSIDILVNIWVKTRQMVPALHEHALAMVPAVSISGEQVWLHYGLTLLHYPFFRETAAAIGQLGRREGLITPAMVKARLFAERGQLGSLEKAVERVLFSLRDWGAVGETNRAHAYAPRLAVFCASSVDLEAWLLACALHANPAGELPFADLLRLPELFPFRFTLTVDDLRGRSPFVVQRQGSGWDMVRVEAV